MPDSFREGDYGSAVYDPGTGLILGRQRVHRLRRQQRHLEHQDRLVLALDAVGTDYYSVNANAGDNLHFATTTPAGGPNEFVNSLYPELLLYDPNGNLVAVAAGNASDGRNSVIDFTVPAGDAGNWIIEVTPSPNTPAPTQGEYGLLVTGATGALSPFVVTARRPRPVPCSSRPRPSPSPSTTRSTLPSLTPGELEVNGVAGHRGHWSTPTP